MFTALGSEKRALWAGPLGAVELGFLGGFLLTRLTGHNHKCMYSGNLVFGELDTMPASVSSDTSLWWKFFVKSEPDGVLTAPFFFSLH